MFNDDSVPSGLINTILPLFSNASQCSNRSVAINQPQRSLVDEAERDRTLPWCARQLMCYLTG